MHFNGGDELTFGLSQIFFFIGRMVTAGAICLNASIVQIGAADLLAKCMIGSMSVVGMGRNLFSGISGSFEFRLLEGIP